MAGTIVVFVSVNRGAVDVILTETGTGTGPTTTDLRWYCVIMRPPVLLIHLPLLSIRSFYSDDEYFNFYRLLPYS